MFDVCKSKALKLKTPLEMGSALARNHLGSRLGDHLPRVSPAAIGRWLPATALLVIAGCSWFDEEPTPPEPTEQSSGDQAKATPAPGEGETMAGEEQEAKTPDVNSVPNEAPKPSIVNLDQAQEGLGSDSSNAQHTDETLTMPTESAARPEKPEENQPEVAATTPETPPAPPTVTPDAVTPAPAPAPTVATAPTPAPAPAPTEQVAMTGTPQAGSKPFEPNGPLNLAPGSLERSAGTPIPTAPTSIASTQLPGSSSAPMTQMATNPAPMPSSADGVSVDYSVLNGLQSGGMGKSYRVVPTQTTAPSGGIAGVGQAVGYVYFGNGSSRLSSADRQVLQQVAQLQRIQGGVLRIIGHASARTGNMEALEQQEVNQRMSLERATAVARALVEYGVQPILVQVAAAGDDQTLYAESTPAGEAGNRRAEVYLSQN